MSIIVPLYNKIITDNSIKTFGVDLYTRHMRYNLAGEKCVEVVGYDTKSLETPIVAAYDADKDEMIVCHRTVRAYKMPAFQHLIDTTKVIWRTPIPPLTPQVVIAGHHVVKYQRIPEEVVAEILQRLNNTLARYTALSVRDTEGLLKRLTSAVKMVLNNNPEGWLAYDLSYLWHKLADFLVSNSLDRDVIIDHNWEFIRYADAVFRQGGGVTVGRFVPFRYAQREWGFKDVQTDSAFQTSSAILNIADAPCNTRNLFVDYDWSKNDKIIPFYTITIEGEFEEIVMGHVPVFEKLTIRNYLGDTLYLSQLDLSRSGVIALDNCVNLKYVMLPVVDRLFVQTNNCNTHMKLLTKDGKKHRLRWVDTKQSWNIINQKTAR